MSLMPIHEFSSIQEITQKGERVRCEIRVDWVALQHQMSVAARSRTGRARDGALHVKVIRREPLS